jgi:hypothetical protein
MEVHTLTARPVTVSKPRLGEPFEMSASKAAYIARLVVGGAMVELEAEALMQLYGRARAAVQAMGKVPTREEILDIYTGFKLCPDEEELSLFQRGEK